MVEPIKLYPVDPIANLQVCLLQDPVSSPRTEMERHCSSSPLDHFFCIPRKLTLLLAFVVNMFTRPKSAVYLLLLDWPLLDRILEMRGALRNTLVVSVAHFS